MNRYYLHMNTASLPQLLNALSRAMLFEQRQAAVGAGLLPVQLAMLGYLRDANRYVTITVSHVDEQAADAVADTLLSTLSAT